MAGAIHESTTQQLPADGVATAAVLLREVRRVTNRARALRVRPWAPLATFGIVLLAGVDVLRSPPVGSFGLRCTALLQSGRRPDRCADATSTTSLQVLAVTHRGSLTSIAVTGHVPMALSLGTHWWFWSAAICAALGALAAVRRVGGRGEAPTLRSYAVAMVAALACQCGATWVSWSPSTAGVFAVGSGLALLGVGERQRLLLGASAAIVLGSAGLRNPPTITWLPASLPPRSAIELALGVCLLAVAAIRWPLVPGSRPAVGCPRVAPRTDDA